MNEKVELCSKLCMSWRMHETIYPQEHEYDGLSEYSQKSFIAQVLRKKMEAFGVPVRIPDSLIALIEVCTQSNPGISQIMLAEIIGENRKKGTTICTCDFLSAYTHSFPIVEEGNEWDTYFTEKWDRQKDTFGNNLVDTPRFWLSKFKEDT